MSSATALWGDRIAVEVLGGVPLQMYTERPRRVEHLLGFADRWGARPHIVQGERVVTFDVLRHAIGAKAGARRPRSRAGCARLPPGLEQS